MCRAREFLLTVPRSERRISERMRTGGGNFAKFPALGQKVFPGAAHNKFLELDIWGNGFELMDKLYYNYYMLKCSNNPTARIVRIILSVAIIVLGIIYKSWLGLIGVITLITAFTGGCFFSFKVNSHKDFKLKK